MTSPPARQVHESAPAKLGEHIRTGRNQSDWLPQSWMKRLGMILKELEPAICWQALQFKAGTVDSMGRFFAGASFELLDCTHC